MKRLPAPRAFSLRVKLILSYIGVALGAIVILAIVVSLAVQNYFNSTQQNLLRARAENFAQQVGYLYSRDGWNFQLETYGPVILIDTSGRQLTCAGPASLSPINCNDPVLKQALAQGLQGQEVIGQIQGTTADNQTFPGFYISLPVRFGGQPDGQIIGALLQIEPQQYPRGFSPYEFLANVNTAIFITGLIVALIVFLFSLLLARSLTRPLEALTAAAEEMKGGNYAQRVAPPRSRDELERLAVSFNAMADTIESDVNELRRQEQLRRDLLANIAHDLATPLTAIQGFSEALADDVISDPGARHETALLIGREVQRLRRLVSDMQNMTALETGRMQFDRAPLNLRALVDEVVAVIGSECEQAGITLRNEIPPTLPPALADSDRITQVLLNLLDNARRYTPAGGIISVGAKLEADAHGAKWLEISVLDSGSGIDAADLPFIFDRFFRIDRSRSASHDGHAGSGLGLAIVKAIVTGHGGSVRAESEPGKGTRISFTLPVAESFNLQVRVPPR